MPCEHLRAKIMKLPSYLPRRGSSYQDLTIAPRTTALSKLQLKGRSVLAASFNQLTNGLREPGNGCGGDRKIEMIQR